MVLDQILEVFENVGEWIPTAVNSLVPMFWTAPAETGGTGSLTFLGVLAVSGLAFSIIFLLVGIIQRFLRFSA